MLESRPIMSCLRPFALSRALVAFAIVALWLTSAAAGADGWWGTDTGYATASWSVTDGCATQTTSVSAGDDLQWSRDDSGPRLPLHSSWVNLDMNVFDACTNEYIEQYSGFATIDEDAFTASANVGAARLVAAFEVTNVLTGEPAPAEIDLVFAATGPIRTTSRYFDHQRNPFVSALHGAGRGVYRPSEASGSVRIGERELAAGDHSAELVAGRSHSMFSASDAVAILDAASTGETITTHEEAAWGEWFSWSPDLCRLTQTWVIAYHTVPWQGFESRSFSFFSQVWDDCAQSTISVVEGQASLQPDEFDYDHSGRVRLSGTLTARESLTGLLVPVSVDLSFDPSGPAATRRTMDTIQGPTARSTVRVDERWHSGGLAINPEARSLEIEGSITVGGSPCEPGELNWSNASERSVRATSH
jgi:hypothetical protein